MSWLLGHAILPFVAIDGVTVALLVVGIAPWLRHVFRAFELPGIGRFEYPDLERAEAEVARVGLIGIPTAKQTEALPPSARDDPLIALAAMRIELEKRLRQLAASAGVRLGERPGSIGMLARELGSSGVITPQEAAALADMAGTLNRAVHAMPVNPKAADWVLAVGPSVLASLDAKVSTLASSNSKT